MRISSIGLFLSLALTGCATTTQLVVPHADWEAVSLDARTQIDARADAELARAHADEAAARTALVAARQEVHPPIAVAAPATGPAEVVDHEQQRVAAMARVSAANEAWVRARLAWHAQRLAEVTARIPVIEAAHELARAKLIDHQLLGSDTYDTASYRGQLSRVQERWYLATRAVDEAREALATASAQLSSLKEEYAQIARRPPTVTVGRSLQLAGFSYDRHVAPTYLKLR